MFLHLLFVTQIHKKNFLAMQANIPAPNTNRGVSAGMNQPSFGIRNGNMKFPSNITNSQPPPTSASRGRRTIKVSIKPAPNNWDKKWGVGDWLLFKSDANMLKTAYDIPLFRYLTYQSAISKHLDDIEILKNKSSSAPKSIFDGGSNMNDAIDMKYKKSRATDYGFLSTLESIDTNLELGGVLFNDTSPETQVGTMEVTNSVAFSGLAKEAAVMVEGDCYMPMLFSNKIMPSQGLYMMIKPQKPQRQYANPLMQTFQVPSDIKDWHLIPDLVFYTTLGGGEPPYLTSMDDLLYKRDPTMQPPLTDRAYIEWGYDERENVNMATRLPYVGELKQAILYKIGKAYNMESPITDNSYRGVPRPQDPLPFADFSAMKKMQFDVHVDKIYANA